MAPSPWIPEKRRPSVFGAQNHQPPSAPRMAATATRLSTPVSAVVPMRSSGSMTRSAPAAVAAKKSSIEPSAPIMWAGGMPTGASPATSVAPLPPSEASTGTRAATPKAMYTSVSRSSPKNGCDQPPMASRPARPMRIIIASWLTWRPLATTGMIEPATPRTGTAAAYTAGWSRIHASWAYTSKPGLGAPTKRPAPPERSM